MSYQTYLQGINSNLKTVYGEYADWEKCIEKYFESEQYTANYHYVRVARRFQNSAEKILRRCFTVKKSIMLELRGC